jgi:hypothetical protein
MLTGADTANGEAERELYCKDREPGCVIDEKTGPVIRTHKGKGSIFPQQVR